MTLLRRAICLASLALLLGAAEPTEPPPPPFQLSRVPPKYPKEAARKKIEGRVDFSITVGTDGRVAAVVILNSVPPGVFDDAARASVFQWRFTPRCTETFDQPFGVRTSVEFKLTDDPNAAASTLFSMEEHVNSGPGQRIVQTEKGFSIEAVDPCAAAKP